MGINTPNVPVGTSVYELLGHEIVAGKPSTRRFQRAAVLAAFMELQAGSGLAFATKAQADANLNYAPFQQAMVWNDTAGASGVYQKTGASGSGGWTRLGDLPVELIRLEVTGGTGDAITATMFPAAPLNLADKAYILVPAATNTGAVTINGVPVKSALGSPLAGDSLIAGVPVMMLWAGDHYQLLVSLPADTAGVVADAIAARDAANGYATAAAAYASALGNQVYQFDNRTLAAAATIPAGVKGMRIYGYAAIGDAPEADYVRVAAQPAHIGRIRSTDRFLPDGSTDATNGGWWEIRTTRLDSRMVGTHLSASDCAVAFQAFIDCASAIKARAEVHVGAVYDFPSGSVNLPAGIDLDLRGATLRRTVDIDPGIPLLQAIGSSGALIDRGRITGGLFKYTPSTTVNTITNNTAIWLKFCRAWHVRDVRFEGAFYIGVRYDDCIDSTLDQFEMWGIYNRAVYVAATFYTEDIHVSNGLCDGYAFGTTTRLTNHIINTNGYGTGTGRHITFTNVVSRHASISPTGEGFSFAERIQNQKAVNCRAVDCPTGFLIPKANGFSALNVQLVNCEADSCDRGVYGVDSSGIEIANFRSDNHAIAGFDFMNCTVVTLTGCKSNGSGTGTCDGYLFEGTTSGVVMSANTASNNTGTGFKSLATCSNIVGRANYAALNGAGASMLGSSGIDFPTGAGSGNLIV